MMQHTALLIIPVRKQLTSMSNPTIHCKLSRKFQDLLKKVPAYLQHQQRKYLKIRKVTISSVYDNADITKIKLHRRKLNEINKKSLKRNILWFNQPYSKSVKTNICKIFLCLINKNFPPTHKYRKIFNRNFIKISYSCMPNIKSKISTHNKKKIK